MKAKDAKYFLEIIDNSKYTPSEWEGMFLNTVRSVVSRGYTLSDKQENCLRSVATKVINITPEQTDVWLS